MVELCRMIQGGDAPVKLKTDAPPVASRLPNSQPGRQSQNINKAHYRSALTAFDPPR